MLETSEWIYLDLKKTGCTFLRQKLKDIFSDDIFIHTKKHSPQIHKTNIPKILTIRNPYEYYLSLWFYGLDQKGGFFETVKRYRPDNLQKFYGKRTKDNFSYFLDYVLSISNEDYVKGVNNLYWFSLARYKTLQQVFPLFNKYGKNLLDSKLQKFLDIFLIIFIK